MLFLPLQTIGVIHSIANVANQLLNFFLVRRPHVTNGPVTSGRGEILAALANGEIFCSRACWQE
jgi:hypothetical protein